MHNRNEAIQFAKYIHEECVRRSGGQSHDLHNQYLQHKAEVQGKLAKWDDPQVLLLFPSLCPLLLFIVLVFLLILLCEWCN